MSFKFLILLVFCSIFTSCASFLDRRDFEDEMVFSESNEPFFRPSEDFEVVPGDSGRAFRSMSEVSRRTPMTANERLDHEHDRSVRSELIRLENRLSEQDYSSYLKVRDSFNNDSERIYFLGLRRNADRLSYLRSRGIVANTSVDRGIASYSNTGNYSGYGNQRGVITVGMRKSEVTSLWGRPMRIDIAGSSAYENERWAYRRNGVVKYIFFSAGQVEGWAEQ